MNPSDLQKPEPMIWFRTVCRRNGLEPTDDQLAQLAEYARRLLEWNRKINLISRKDEENIWQSHLLHSISLLMRVDFPLGARILDLGTGGGLPGIPIRILRSDLSFVLLDATKKKVEAVQDMIRELSLTSISAVWGRAEELGKTAAQAHRFDMVIARAVAPLDDLAKWSKLFLREPLTGRRLIALKGGDLEPEIRHARRVAGVKNISVVELALAEAGEFLASDKKILVVDF